MASTAQSGAHCVIYGGNGFVGVAAAQQLVALGARVTCVSRRGDMPEHLYFSGADWAKQVNWVAGDALDPDHALLAEADAVVTLIGSPPVPTLSKSAKRAQEFANSEPNGKVIRTAAEQGVKRVVLVAADIPDWMQTPKFGYYLGKRKSIASIEAYASADEQRSAAILYPTGIYGTRYLPSGQAIPLHWFMQPIATVQRCMPNMIAGLLPPTLVAVEQVGLAVAKACLDEFNGIQHIANAEISELMPEIR